MSQAANLSSVLVGNTLTIQSSNVSSITANDVTANTFVGSGSGLTDIPNSALSNSSITINGTQIGLGSSGSIIAGATITNDTTTNATRYVMLGSATSGAYTSANVSSTKLTFNPSTGLLSSTESYANKSYSNDSYIGSSGSNVLLSSINAKIYYISTTGSNSTGDGSYANPWQTLQYAVSKVPLVLYNTVSIVLKNGTYNNIGTVYITGISGGTTSVKLNIYGETAGSVNITGDINFVCENVSCKLYFSGLNFDNRTSYYIFSFNVCSWVEITNTVSISCITGVSGSWQGKIIATNCAYVYASCNIALQSDWLGGLGATILFSGPGNYWYTGTLSKTGTRHGNAAISIQDGAVAYLNGCTFDNFNVGVLLGNYHYGDRMPGHATFNSITISNCQYGAYLVSGSTVTNYYTTFTTNTYNWWNSNGLAGADLGVPGKVLIGYTVSNGSYNLQVNSQIFATSGTIATSDGRYKENVIPLSNALSLISSLNPVQFNWKTHPVHNFDAETPTIGFIAQEVMSAFADVPYLNSIVKKNEYEIKSADIESIEIEPSIPAVYDDNGNVLIPEIPAKYEEVIINPAEKEEFYGIAESNLIALLTKAIQELKQTVDNQQAEIEILKNK